MAKMVRFVETLNGTTIFVNPALVSIVMPSRDQGTDIIFDQGHVVTVVEKTEQVVNRLDEAE
jgi:uncharacterized protein YlzI (FlbEa/FlbD family)